MISPGFLILFLLSPLLIDCASLSSHEATNFLYKFGYLQPSRITAAGAGQVEDAHSKQSNAIRKFQSFTGLRVTGELDRATLEKMAKPRCAEPDVAAMTSAAAIKGILSVWRKKDLTFTIDNLWHRMSEGDIRNAIKSSYDAFSAVTPLKFREVSSGKGDMTLSFASGDHGDGSAFDGRGTILAHAFFPENGRIHFDADEWWTVMNANNLPVGTHTDFFATAMHEIGHAVGLDHVDDVTSIMAAYDVPPIDANGRYVRPHLDAAVISSLQKAYGTPTAPHIPTGPGSNDDCMKHVYGVMNLPGHRIIFFPREGHRFAMFNSMSKQLVQDVPISDIFKNGPSRVTAAYYNNQNERVVLFNGNQVWAYDYNKRTHSMLIGNGYPKRLPVDDKWQTGGALDLKPRMVLVSFDKVAATYNEDRNTMEVLGHISSAYPDMPHDVAGFAEFDYGKFVGFTETKVFKYHRNRESTDHMGAITDIFHC